MLVSLEHSLDDPAILDEEIVQPVSLHRELVQRGPDVTGHGEERLVQEDEDVPLPGGGELFPQPVELGVPHPVPLGLRVQRDEAGAAVVEGIIGGAP